MKQFRLITISLTVFMLLAGCGNFSANNPTLKQAEQTVDASNIDVPQGETPISKDQEILNGYLSRFNNLDPEGIEKLISDIRSFEILVEKDERQFKNLVLRMHSRTNRLNSQGTTLTACHNLIEIRTNYISLSRLQNSVFLGQNSNYEFNIQCTDSNCDEMIASIYRKGSGINEGFVLIGLKSASMNRPSSLYNKRYMSRYVNIEKYFTLAVTPDQYESIVCSIEEDEEVDPTGGSHSNPTNNGSDSEDSIDPISGNSQNNSSMDNNDSTDNFSEWYDLF